MGLRTILTYEDYAALPADGRRYEIHEGELCVTPAPGTRHQAVSTSLVLALGPHVRERRLGKFFAAPIDCILSATTIVQPDIVVVSAEQLSLISERGIEGPPSLVVEIVSPSTTQIDRGSKAQLYARYGVPHFWVVDPSSRTIEAYILKEGTYRPARTLEDSQPVGLPPFPDLLLDPAVIWE